MSNRSLCSEVLMKSCGRWRGCRNAVSCVISYRRATDELTRGTRLSPCRNWEFTEGQWECGVCEPIVSHDKKAPYLTCKWSRWSMLQHCVSVKCSLHMLFSPFVASAVHDRSSLSCSRLKIHFSEKLHRLKLWLTFFGKWEQILRCIALGNWKLLYSSLFLASVLIK